MTEKTIPQLEVEGRLRYAAQRLGSTLLFQTIHGDLLEHARIASLAIVDSPESTGEDLNILLGFAIAIIARKETS